MTGTECDIDTNTSIVPPFPVRYGLAGHLPMLRDRVLVMCCRDSASQRALCDEGGRI
jgi:hypothetical protein